MLALYSSTSPGRAKRTLCPSIDTVPVLASTSTVLDLAATKAAEDSRTPKASATSDAHLDSERHARRPTACDMHSQRANAARKRGPMSVKGIVDHKDQMYFLFITYVRKRANLSEIVNYFSVRGTIWGDGNL